MKTSPRGAALIKQYEGLRLSAYLCPAGVWTIGYGHTGTDVYPGLIVTGRRAEELLEQDLGKFEAAVLRLVKVPLTQNQFDALVSFAFNVGVSALERSTLLKYTNQRKHALAAGEFLKWNKATVNGKKQILLGLVRRRKEESDLYSAP